MRYGANSGQFEGHGPPGRRAARVVAWAAVAIASILIAGALTAYAAFREEFDAVHQIRVTGLGGRPPKYNDALNILVIGSDGEQGENAKFGGRITDPRSDTILVLHLAPELKRAIVLSIPRDSVVPVLSCPPAPGVPGQAAKPGRIEQINAAFASGGPGCLWKTIEHTTRIRLDHFIELNFAGYERVVNDLGGVDICLPSPVNDPRSRLYLPSGLNLMSGGTALAYWRILGSGLERDQLLIASVGQELNSSDLFGNPTKVYQVVVDIASSLTTDSGLTQSALTSLANALQTMKLAVVQFVRLPAVRYPPNPNWVRWAATASSLFSAIAQDRTLPSGVSGDHGGIAAQANVCHDTRAFTDPLGGH
jgi:LCP family protein required for cell wall assembly